MLALCLPTYVSHYSEGANSLERNKEFWPALWATFPDIQFTKDLILAEGDLVANREPWTGTHLGEFMGIPPTGRKVTVTSNNIIRIENGKYAEGWSVVDRLGLMQQLGVIPEENNNVSRR